jgi:hypothetical protein
VALPEHAGQSNAAQVSEESLSVINCGADALIVDLTATISGDYAGADALLRDMFGYQRAELLRHRVDSPIPDGLREARPGHGTAFAQGTPPRPAGTGARLAGARDDDARSARGCLHTIKAVMIATLGRGFFRASRTPFQAARLPASSPRFVELTGGTAAIGSLRDVDAILAGKAGTIVTPSGT